jgi:preprotein translocase subunit SecG
MLALSFIGGVVSVLLIGVSLLLIGLVLLQKNRGAGLSGAFGGVGGHSAFGTKTGDFLTWVTVGLVAVFLLLNIAGNYAFEPESIGAAAPTLAPSAPADAGQTPSPARDAAPQPASPAPQSNAGGAEPKPANPSS